mgnify:CR=1 FL=1
MPYLNAHLILPKKSLTIVLQNLCWRTSPTGPLVTIVFVLFVLLFNIKGIKQLPFDSKLLLCMKVAMLQLSEIATNFLNPILDSTINEKLFF